MNTFKRIRAFCRLLQGNRFWRVDKEALRTRAAGGDGTGEDDFCPLTYAHYVATGDVWPVHHWSSAGRTFGFEHNESRQIAVAADCTHGDEHQKKLRRILERACHVRKEAI